MSLDFGDISGVEPREIPHEESDLENEFFLPLDSFKKSKYVKFFGGYDVTCRVYQDLAPTAFSGKK